MGRAMMGPQVGVMTPEQAKGFSTNKMYKSPELQNAIDQALSTGQNVQYTPTVTSEGLGTLGFQAPEPYVPESAKAAGALYEAGVAPSVIEAAMQNQISDTADYSNIPNRMYSEGDTALSGPNFIEAPTIFDRNYIPPLPDPSREKVSPSMSIPQATTYNLPGTSGSSIPIPTAAEPAPFDPVAYRNQFKPDSGGLASVAQPTPIEPVNLPDAAPTIPQPQTQQMPSFFQQPMPMMPSFFQQPMPRMPQPFNPMGYGPMGMGMGMNRFMNPYGGLGGISYRFQNPNVNPNISAPLPFYATGSLPLYGQGSQFRAGQYQAPEPKINQMAAGMLGSFMPYF
jgi:hypothetical protein